MGKKMEFMVIGAGRGGTSLLTTCLDANPGIEVGEELFTAEYLGGGIMNDHRQRYDMPSRVSGFFNACEKKACNTGKPLFGNKILTENIFWLQDCLPTMQQNPLFHVDYFFKHVPDDLKIIFIIRDGRNIIASKVKWTQQPVSHALFRYKYFMIVLKYLKNNYSPLKIIRFEDLVHKPEEELRGISDFLGAEYSSAMLTTRGKTMPSYYEKSYFDKTRADKIADMPAAYMPLIKEDLEFCGYL